MKTVLRTIGYAVALVLFLLIVLASFTQTKLFKDRLRVFIASFITTQTNGSLSLGTIHGNFISGFTIDSLVLWVGKDPLIATGRIAVGYDLFEIPNRVITIDSIVIERPNVALRRDEEGVWNIDRLAPPSEVGKPSRFEWTIILKKLRLINGSVVVKDERDVAAADHPPNLPNQVDYGNVSIFNLNLGLNGRIRENNVSLAVEHLSFESERPLFQLRRFGGKFAITDHYVSAKNLTIETSRSRIALDAEMRNLNLFEGIDLEHLQHKPIDLELLADNIDLNELKSFIPAIDFLNGSAYVDLKAGEEFGDLAIERLNVQTYGTAVRLTGEILNLHDPENLVINAHIFEGQTVPGDADRLLPAFQIPRFEKVGPTKFTAEYVGRPLNFQAKVNAASNVGAVQADIRFNLEKDQIVYEGTFQTNALQLAKILDEQSLEGRITARGEITGSGTTLAEVDARFHATIDTSLIGKAQIQSCEIDAKMRNSALTAGLRVSSSAARVLASIEADLADQQHPSYDIQASVDDLDLGRLLGEKKFISNIACGVSLRGRGLSLDDALGQLDVRFSESTFGQHRFGGEQVSLTLEHKDGQGSRLSLTSPIADLEIEGTFTPLDLWAQVACEADIVQHAIRERTPHFKSIGHDADGPQKAEARRYIPHQQALDVNIQCAIKDLSPASVLLGDFPYNGIGMLEAKVKANASTFSLAANAKADDLFFGRIDKGTLLEDASVILTYERDRSAFAKALVDLEGVSININGRIRHAIVGKVPLDSVQLELAYRDLSGRFEIRTTIDTTLLLETSGAMEAHAGGFRFHPSHLSIASETATWTAKQPLELGTETSGIRLSELLLKHGDEEISLNGSVAVDGPVDMSLAGRNIELGSLFRSLGLRSLRQAADIFSGRINVSASVKGSTEAPIGTININGSDLAVRGKPIGILNAQLRYADELAEAEIRLSRDGADSLAAPLLTAVGRIPVNLALGKVEKRFPDRPMDVRIRSDGLPLDIVDPLTTTLDDLRGSMHCDIALGATPSAPSYRGTIELRDVGFLFVPNNISYTLAGSLQAQDERLQVSGMRVQNLPRDRDDGIVDVTGYFTIKNFAIGDFDLRATGQLLVVNPSTRKTLQTMYGTLFASTGSGGLHYRGNFDDSYLSGELYVKEATLVFPPTGTTVYSTTGAIVDYVVVDDTSKRASPRKLAQRFYAEAPADSLERASQASKPTRTILDGMNYNLTIETQGKAEIRIIFTQATNEELFAELDGKLFLQKSDSRPQMTGEISVSERSYYNFFKRFDASGTLNFVGSPDNPELKIKATYQGKRRPPELPPDSLATEQTVIVTLDITGTRYEPKLTMSMTVDGDDWASQSKGGDIQSDAISFILTGKFTSDLTSKEKSDIISNLSSAAGSSILYGLPSQMLSGVLTDFLRNEFGFIRSAEVTYQGGSLQETADLRLSGELFRAYWRFGGRIFNDIGNANVSFAVSMGEILSDPSLRNLFIELERRVEGTELVEQKKLTNAARIYYKFSF
jgi:autotransporter translocation and assembly factor TamB